MRSFQPGIVYAWATDDDKKSIDWNVPSSIYAFFHRRKIFRRVVRAYAQSQKLSLKPILLIAHGTARHGRWYFTDPQGKMSRMQDWIDEHDGKAGALLVLSCNKRNLEIRSRLSLVIHLNRIAGLLQLYRGGCLRLHHPEFGYIENNYYRMRSIIGY